MGEVLKEKYSKNVTIVVYPIASLLLIANNTINIGAMAAPVRLISPQTPTIAATISFAALYLLQKFYCHMKNMAAISRRYGEGERYLLNTIVITIIPV